MTAPARPAAYHALRAVAADRMDLPSALAHSRRRLADDRDRALAAEIVTGTLRWQRALDHLIAHFAGRSLDRLDDEIVVVLRLSLYQLLHLDRVPASAVVDDAVDLARAAGKPSATGFVNAVLRSVARERHRLPLPPRPPDDSDRDAALAYLSVTRSHPEWLISRWLDRYGFEAVERWTGFDNEIPRVTLRANTLRTTRDEVARQLADRGVVTEPAPHAPEALVVTAGTALRRDSHGRFFIQDEASQLVPLVVAARPGERVLDLCAAPGGKTMGLAAEMNDTGVLMACDVRPRRIALLRDTVREGGTAHTHVVQVAGRGPLPTTAAFDRVLVDAPCSGLGTLRRDPDIRWRRQETDLARFAEAQLTLLSRAAEVVRPGGRLVYATCSSEPEENEQVVDTFLTGRSDFAPVDLRGRSHASLSPLLDARGMLRTLPFTHRLEAFFAAALERR